MNERVPLGRGKSALKYTALGFGVFGLLVVVLGVTQAWIAGAGWWNMVGMFLIVVGLGLGWIENSLPE